MNSIEKELNAYRQLMRDIRNARKTVELLKAIEISGGSLAPKEVKVLTSLPLSAKFEDAVIDRVELEKIIAQELDRARELREHILVMIYENVPRVEQRQVLYLRYILLYSWPEISSLLQYSEQYCHKLKHKAIRQIDRKISKVDSIV